MASPLHQRQLYEFDVTGQLIIKNFLDKDTVTRLNSLIDGAYMNQPEQPHKFSVLDLHTDFFDLLSNPKAMQICKYMLGDWFRFDHAYGLQVQKAHPDGTPTMTAADLHGGPKANQGSFRYSWFNNRPQCGLLVFAYIMEPAKAGDGGFVVVPGSHKQNMGVEGREVFLDMLGGTHNAWWVQQPVVEAGDLLIFTEALVHGTRPWRNTEHRRRNLYYKYTPGHLCWRDHNEIKKYACLARTDLERDLMRPPTVAGYGEDAGVMGTNNWRSPTRV